MGEAGTLAGSSSSPVTWRSLLGQGLTQGRGRAGNQPQDIPEEAGSRRSLPRACSWPPLSSLRGSREVRIKGWGGRRELVGGMGLIKSPAGCPKGRSWRE